MRIFLTVVLIFLIRSIAGALENPISRALLLHLGVSPDRPGIPAVIDSSFNTGRTFASVKTGYNDVLHYSDETGTGAGIDAFCLTGSAVYPLPRKGTALFYHLDLGFLSAALGRSNDFVSAAPKIPSGKISFGSFFNEFFGDARAVVEGAYGYTRSSGKTSVKSWPSADDPDLNTFLFDLLEPTFGNAQDYAYSRVNRDAKAVLEYGPVYLSGVVERNNGEMLVGYTNTDPDSFLIGDKETSFTTETYGFELGLGARFAVNRRLKGKAGVRYAAWDGALDMTPLNPTPGSNDSVAYLDKTDWGGGMLDRNTRGVCASLSYALNPSHEVGFDLQAALSDWDGSGELFTPVLGWELSLPIVHTFTGRVTMDMLTQGYGLKWSGKIGPSLTAGAGLDWVHADIDIFIDGEAGIEFNIVTTDVDADYEYNADIYSLNGHVYRAISDRWELGLELEQTVPVFTKVKEVQHTGPGPQPGPGIEKNMRGGTDVRLVSKWTL